MWVVYLEMGIALGLLILIVWFTWPRGRGGGGADERPPDREPRE